MRRGRRCPRCGAPAAPGEIICLACGRLLRDPRRPPRRSRPRWGVFLAGVALGLAVAHLGAAAPRPAPAPAVRARPAPAAVVGWQHVLHGTLGPAGAILFPVWLVGPRGRVATLAELDTGNQRSPVVSISLARQVGLPITGTTPLLGVVPGAQVPAPVYGGATVIPAGPYVRGDPGRLTLPRLLGVSGSIGFAGLLLGQTVLAHTRLVEQAGQWWWAWNGPGGHRRRPRRPPRRQVRDRVGPDHGRPVRPAAPAPDPGGLAAGRLRADAPVLGGGDRRLYGGVGSGADDPPAGAVGRERARAVDAGLAVAPRRCRESLSGVPVAGPDGARWVRRGGGRGSPASRRTAS